jgi:hypothetical protein
MLATTAAGLGIQEHGSQLPDTVMAPAAPPSPRIIIHGWNCPMPIPGTSPIGKRITIPHLRAAASLARAIYHLISLSQAKTSSGRALVAHQLIAEFLASVEGGSFDVDTVEGLMFSLEESGVVDVTSHEPGGQEEIQYFYEFLVEPNFTMSG